MTKTVKRLMYHHRRTWKVKMNYRKCCSIHLKDCIQILKILIVKSYNFLSGIRDILVQFSCKKIWRIYKRIFHWNIITFFKDRESSKHFAVIAIFAIIFIFYRVEVCDERCWVRTILWGKCRYIPIYRRRYPSAKLLMVVSFKQFYFWRFSNMGSD